MKTTIEIADDVLERARQLAQRDGTTIRALTEEGLRLVLEQRESKVHADFEPVVVHGTTPPEAVANLHQIILDGYAEHVADQIRRMAS